ncbi:hypothetical protein BDD43_3178 [Mucilaginibacter gracilis]|uniref:Uncharacterized protein n=1 Tax=Mucilaginibacter gracilis TaxID=423350 RepID=A0A495J4S1_9SPHI|nr:hypothetical protein [Mucilaginibacter gracilis]RKR82979.1 hypothetical protein BDD43_3178 [Mucilaginibacter gracilis]
MNNKTKPDESMIFTSEQKERILIGLGELISCKTTSNESLETEEDEWLNK